MAADPQAVEHLVTVLKQMGYTVGPGHVQGKVDAGFAAAFEPALKDLLKIGIGDGAEYNAENAQKLLTKAQQKRGEVGLIAAMESYSQGQDYDPLGQTKVGLPPVKSKADIRAGLAAEGFSQQLMIPANVAGVVTFFKGAEGYMKDIAAVMPEVQALKAAQSGPAAPAGGAPANQPDAAAAAARQAEAARVEAERQAAAARQAEATRQAQAQAQAQAQVVQKIKSEISDLQKDFLGYAPAEANGEDTPAFREKLRTYVKKMQEEDTNWKGNKDGVLSPEFLEHLNGSTVPAHGAFLSAVIELDAALKPKGASVQVLTSPAASPSVTGVPVVAPPAGGAGAAAGAPGTGAAPGGGQPPVQPPPVLTPGTPPTPAQVEYASAFIETFLGQAAGAINANFASRREKGGLLVASLFEFNDIPLPGTPDATFDPASRTSLQAILKANQAALELTDDEIYNYDPTVTGGKLRKNLPKLLQNMTPAQKEELRQKGGVEAIVRSLDILKASGQLGNGEKLYEGSPFKLTGIGASILGWIFKFIGSVFPSARPLMDNLLKTYTGGYSYNDLMPKEQRDPALDAAARKYANLPPEEQFRQLYLDALKGAAGPGKDEKQIRDQLQQTLMTGVKAMMNLPMGDDASRAAYEAAVNEALTKATAAGSVDEAAATFATTFREKWTPARVVDSNSGLPTSTPPTQFTTDPNIANFKVENFVEKDVRETFTKMYKMAERDGTKHPMIFKMPDGSIQAMGVTGSKMLTIQALPTEAIALLDKAIVDMKAATTTEARQAILTSLRDNKQFPAFEMLIGGYGDAYPLEGLRGEITNARLFSELKRDIDTRYANMLGEDRKAADDQRAASARDAAARRRQAHYRSDSPTNHVGGGGRREWDVSGSNADSGGSNARVLGGDRRAALHEQDQEVLLRSRAMGNPALIKNDYDNTGLIRIMYCDDYNGVRSAQARTRTKQEALVQSSNSFKVVNITREYRNFMEGNPDAPRGSLQSKGFFDFCRENERQLAGMSDKNKLLEYKRYYEFNKGNFSQDFPEMARIIYNPSARGGGINYSQFYLQNGRTGDGANIIGLVDYLRGQMGRENDLLKRRMASGNFDDSAPPPEEHHGNAFTRGLKRIFGRAHDHEEHGSGTRGGHDNDRIQNAPLPPRAATDSIPGADHVPVAIEATRATVDGAAFNNAGNDMTVRSTSAPAGDDPLAQEIARINAAREATQTVKP